MRVMPVPSGIAAVHATTRSSWAIVEAKASENAAVKARPLLAVSTLQPFTWKAGGEWNLVALPSAWLRVVIHQPLPQVNSLNSSIR